MFFHYHAALLHRIQFARTLLHCRYSVLFLGQILLDIDVLHLVFRLICHTLFPASLNQMYFGAVFLHHLFYQECHFQHFTVLYLIPKCASEWSLQDAWHSGRIALTALPLRRHWFGEQDFACVLSSSSPIFLSFEPFLWHTVTRQAFFAIENRPRSKERNSFFSIFLDRFSRLLSLNVCL